MTCFKYTSSLKVFPHVANYKLEKSIEIYNHLATFI